jgi:hypothetical protein
VESHARPDTGDSRSKFKTGNFPAQSTISSRDGICINEKSLSGLNLQSGYRVGYLSRYQCSDIPFVPD